MYQIYETQLVYSSGAYDKAIISMNDVCDIEGLDRMTYTQMVARYGEALAKFYIDEAIGLMRKEGKIK